MAEVFIPAPALSVRHTWHTHHVTVVICLGSKIIADKRVKHIHGTALCRHNLHSKLSDVSAERVCVTDHRPAESQRPQSVRPCGAVTITKASITENFTSQEDWECDIIICFSFEGNNGVYNTTFLRWKMKITDSAVGVNERKKGK